MKIKVIELLTKMSIGEIPKKIKFKNNIYVFKKDSYYTEFENVRIRLQIAPNLNDEVEIIEESKKIEKIARCDSIKMTHYGELYKPTENEEILRIKINELIDAVNELKRDK